jgi:hypothetical protein
MRPLAVVFACVLHAEAGRVDWGKAIAKADRDGDGQLSKQEVHTFFEKR